MAGFRPKRLVLCGIAAFAATCVAVAVAREAADTPNASEAAPPAAEAQRPNSEQERAIDGHHRPYVWSARRRGSTLTLRGFVPSEDDRRTVLGMVKAHFADLEVEDQLRVANGGPPREQWLGAVSFGLKQLSHLKQGSSRLMNDGIKVEGEARSGDDYIAVKKALAAPMPAGLVLLNENIRPPVVSPFTFVAALSRNALTLTGSVPNEDLRKLIKDWSRRYFERPALDDRLELASGAPKRWDDAVEASLKALSRLDTGKVSLTGVAIAIEGIAPDKNTAISVAYQLKQELPDLFSSSESIRWKEADISHTMGIGELILPRIKAVVHSDDLSTGSLPAGGE